MFLALRDRTFLHTKITETVSDDVYDMFWRGSLQRTNDIVGDLNSMSAFQLILQCSETTYV